MGARDREQSELAASLARARRSAGLTQEQIRARTGISQSRLSHAESGRRLLSREQVEQIARECGVDDAERERLVALAIAATRDHVDSRLILQRGAITFQDRVRRLEDTASRVREFQPAQVTGVCQTADYVRAIFGQTPGRYTAAELDRLVRQRVARGAALVEDRARSWEIVHTEGAFGWALGGPLVMAAQIDHLAGMSLLPHVRIGVVPFGRPVDFTAHHGFSIYDSSTAQVGTLSGTALPDDRDDVAVYAGKFDRVLAAAVFDDDARAILARIAADYRKDEIS